MSPARKNYEHGTNGRYAQGCHCGLCRKAHADHHRAWWAQNRERNREAQRPYKREWGQKNRDKVRAYYRANVVAITAKNMEWRRANKDKRRGYDHARRARIGRSSQETIEWMALVVRDPCTYCGNSGGTVDHVVPLSSGGEHEHTNLVGSCNRCNARKGTRSLLTFLIA